MGDELFFVAAIAGAPGLWVERANPYVNATSLTPSRKVLSPFGEMFDTKIRYSIASETSDEAKVLAIIYPLVSKEMSNAEQALEAAAVDVENAAELFRLATAATFGK